MKTFYCAKCGQKFSGTISSYAITKDEQRICYRCCAENDRAQMQEQGEITLYLEQTNNRLQDGQARNPKTGNYWQVSNWPGTLKFPVLHFRRGRHNIAGTQVTVEFRDHTGAKWYGRQVGNYSQLRRCKRYKTQADAIT